MNQATKKNLKQFFIVAGALLTILAIVITSIAIYLYNTKDSRAEEKRLRANQFAIEYIELYVGIVIPDDTEIIYQESIHARDSTYYDVFKFNKDPTEWLRKNGFNKNKSEEFEKDWKNINLEFLENHVSKDYYPNFDGEYYWLKRGWYHFVYLPDKAELIFFVQEF